MPLRIFLLSIIILNSNILSAQNNIDTLFSSISKRLSSYPLEQVYLQTSKGIYETGEDLWFKAYLLDAQTFGLSERSKTLYLQMVNDKDSTVWREKYLIENGVADGHVYVDEKLADGNYSLEAYTRYSFSDDTIGILSSRKIRIIKNIAYDNDQLNQKIEIGLRFNLFAEGGDLVDGIYSHLAFKATDGSGYPAHVEGSLYIDDVVATTFKSSHDGMGSISLIPSVSKKYRIELTDGSSYSLPQIQKQGITLRLSKQDQQQIEFVVSQTKGLPRQEIYLLGQMRGMVCCVAKGMLKDNLKITIPASEFNYQGIAEFTLLNGAMQPVAERLVYVHPEKKLQVSVEPLKDKYSLREEATLKIKVTDEQGNPVKANLAVSVFDKAYHNLADPTNILTHSYLCSQIRGTIHNPAYYFNDDNKDRAQSIDLLLLTQGWRRYVWSVNNLAQHGEMFLTDEISGTHSVESKKKSKQTQDSEQLIQVSGAKDGSLFVWADSVGSFTVGTDIMKELRGGYIYLKSMLPKEFKPEMKIVDYFPIIDSIRRDKPSYYPIIDLSQTKKEEVFDMALVSSDSTILIDEVTVQGRKQRVFRDKFMGRLDSLAQMKSGAWVCKHGWLENYKEGYTHHHDARYCPSVADDGRPGTAPIIGKKYHIMKAKYYFVNSTCAFTPIDHQIITYEGENYSEEELLRMNNTWSTKGYYAVREFYQPDEIERQLSIPDARNTLLWQPTVTTDEKGEATVSFYCSDINTKFAAVIEGVDGTGLLGNGECEFRVIRKAK